MSISKNKQDGNILIVDDDSGILTSAQLFLKQYFKQVFVELNPDKIKSHFDKRIIDIVLLDMNFSKGKNDGEDGFNYLKEILKLNDSTIVIFMTAYGDIEMAVEALKCGAIDFITKPWKNEKLLTTIETAIKLSTSQKKIEQLKSENQTYSETQSKSLEGFIGESPAFKQVKQMLNKISPTEASLLILGENGTGKGLAAKYIHDRSDRCNEPFITVDMGTISDSLFESELFGHEKGAFTDASSKKTGRFEIANRGTLFLDEVGNIPLASQAKLLSVLQNKTITRLGSNIETNIDIRLICATNMPLAKMVEQGEFRQDLLYRINTVEIRMPSLNERIADIDLLLKHYLEQFKIKYKKPKLEINAAEVDLLKRMNWPGNIREFQHAIERAVILADAHQLTLSDFQKPLTTTAPINETRSLDLNDMEISFIKKAMLLHNGNITHAAKELGIDRLALHRRLEKYGIQ